MAAVLHLLDQRRLIDSNGISDGGTIAFYLTGTTTPITIYSDVGLTTPLTNPVTVAAGAAVPDIYYDNSQTVRRLITYSDGSTDDSDPYAPQTFVVSPVGLLAANNLSDVSSASTSRTNLGLAIGSDVQAYSSLLADIAGLTLSQGDILYYNGTDIVNLGAGTSGQFLKTQGAGANPTWADAGTTDEAHEIAMSDLYTELATGDDKATWVVPYDFTLSEVFTAATGAQSTSGVVTIDIRLNGGSSIFSTKPSIDANEDTSLTGTVAVLSTTSLSKGDILQFDLDAAGTGAKGLIAVLVGEQT